MILVIIGYFGIWTDQIIKYKQGKYNPYFFKKEGEESNKLQRIFFAVFLAGLCMINDNYFKKSISIFYFCTNLCICGIFDFLMYKKQEIKKSYIKQSFLI